VATAITNRATFARPGQSAIKSKTAAAVALAVNAAGAVAIKTVVLLTPEEVDAAAERSVSYRPPGS
jgi:hypothetical protein